MDFKIGDVVRLKSDGPRMTVKSIKDGEVWCNWFDKEGKLAQPQWFEPDMLKLVEHEEQPGPRVVRVRPVR
jgi:uncharacterized protein YodC (DUF2158 family)